MFRQARFVLQSPLKSLCILTFVLCGPCHHLASAALQSSSPFLSQVSVLLPPVYGSSITVLAYNGCYKWTSNNKALIGLEEQPGEVDESCSQSAIVSFAGSGFSGRRSTYIIAKETTSGITLRCEVFVDKVIRLGIEQNTRRIYIDSLASIEMKGYDREDNMFSTLTGLKFQWDVKQVGQKASGMFDSLMGQSPCTIMPNMQDHSKLALKGSSVGLCNLTGECTSCVNKDLKASIKMQVVESLMMLPEPPPILLCFGHNLQMSLLRTYADRASEPINLPSNFYQWKSESPALFTIHEKKAFITTKDLGQSMVVLLDTRVDGWDEKSELEIVEPANVAMSVKFLPGKDQEEQEAIHFLGPAETIFLTVGKKYHLSPLALDDEGRSLILTNEKAVSMLRNNTKIWNTQALPADRVVKFGGAGSVMADIVSEGTSAVQIGLSRGDKGDLRTDRDVETCDPVHVVKPAGITPAANILRLAYVEGGLENEYYLDVGGGCAGEGQIDFWSSGDKDPIAVAGSRVKAAAEGQGRVSFSTQNDLYPNHNTGAVDVEVSFPSFAKPDEFASREVEIGETIFLDIVYLNEDEYEYHNCSSLIYSVRFAELDVGHLSTPKVEISKAYERKGLAEGVCASLVVRGLEVGETYVEALLDGPNNKRIAIKWFIQIFPPLCVEPGDVVRLPGSNCSHGGGRLVGDYALPVGQGMWFHMSGGPDSIAKPGQGQSVRLEPVDGVLVYNEDQGGVPVGQDTVWWTKSKHSRAVEVVCFVVGNYSVVFGTGVSETSFLTERVVSLACDLPTHLVVLAGEDALALYGMKKSPPVAITRVHKKMQVQLSEGMVLAPQVVTNGQEVPLNTILMDGNLRMMYNTSAFDFEWKFSEASDVSNMTLAPKQAQRAADLDIGPEFVGAFSVVVSLASMRAHAKTPASMVRVLRTALQSRAASLSDALSMTTVPGVTIEPERIVCMPLEGKPVVMEVKGGSQVFDVSANDTSVADVSVQLGAEVGASSIITVHPKRVGVTSIKVFDKSTLEDSYATVVVTLPHAVAVALEKPTIKMGDLLRGQLLITDVHEEAIHFSQYPALTIKPHLHDTRLAESGPLIEMTPTQCNIKLRAANFGEASFHISVTPPADKKIFRPLRSSHYVVTIFEPVSINLAGGRRMLVGTAFTLTSRGGSGGKDSGGGALIWQYSSNNTDVLTIGNEHTGCIIGMSPGHATLYAVAMGPDGTVYGEDSLEIIVQDIKGIRMLIQDQIVLGEEMHAYVTGLEAAMDLLNIAQACTSYTWSVDNPAVLGMLQGLPTVSLPSRSVKTFIPGCHRKLTNANFGARLAARSLGTATVKVTATCGAGDKHTYSASRTVKVVQPLNTFLGMPQPWVLPTEYTTPPLLPDETKTRYTILQDPLHEDAVLTVDGGGRIVTGNRTDVACIHSVPKPGTPFFPGPPVAAACVRVAEVAQMTVDGNNLPAHYMEVSVGTVASFTVALRDKWSNPLQVVPAEYGEWEVDSSEGPHNVNAALVGAQLQVDMRQEGSTAIRLRLKRDPRVVGYVVVYAGDYIRPRSPQVYLGAVLLFTVHRQERDRAVGVWYSGNERVVRVDAETGVASAVGEGATTVHFNSTEISMYTHVTVTRVMHVHVAAPADTAFLSNGPLGWEYDAAVPPPKVTAHFPVAFGDYNDKPIGKDLGKGDAQTQHHIDFECRVVPEGAGRIRAVTDSVHGHPACELDLAPPGAAGPGVHNATALQVVAAVRGAGDGGSAVEGKASVPFVAGFQVAPGTAAELRIPRGRNGTTVTLHGNTAQVELSWNRRDFLQVEAVGGAKGSWLGGGGGPRAERTTYRLLVAQGAPPFTDHLTFTNPASGQTATITLQLGTTSGGIGTTLYTLIVLLIGGVIAIVFFFQPESQPPAKARPNPSRGPTPPMPAYDPINGRGGGADAGDRFLPADARGGGPAPRGFHNAPDMDRDSGPLWRRSGNGR